MESRSSNPQVAFRLNLQRDSESGPETWYNIKGKIGRDLRFRPESGNHFNPYLGF
jgi:hypothetical protein